jgi:predicted RNA binding protein YcfA (HicA-like mRNA interferase family)
MPSWKDYERFLKNDGWKLLLRNSGVDRTYLKQLLNGVVLRTRVSKSSKEIGRGLFASILKNQVGASKEYFNKVLASRKHSSDDPRDRSE